MTENDLRVRVKERKNNDFYLLQETLISSLVFPHFPPLAINVFLSFIIALICISELTLVS